jgi:hypothetical protein
VKLPLQSFVGAAIFQYPRVNKSINEMLDNKQAKHENATDELGHADPETLKRLHELKYIERVYIRTDMETIQSESPAKIRNAIAKVQPRNTDEENFQERILNRIPAIPSFEGDAVRTSDTVNTASSSATSMTTSSTTASSTTTSSSTASSTTTSSTTASSTTTSSNTSSNATLPTPPFRQDTSDIVDDGSTMPPIWEGDE